jgi:hypothetical protein
MSLTISLVDPAAADLVRDHGEPAAALARASGVDGRVVIVPTPR